MEGASETGCCKRFDPKPWDGKGISWKGKPFLKDRVFCLFRIPLNMGNVVVRDMRRIAAAGALAQEQLMLYDSNSLWGADVLIAVSKDVPGAKMERLSGTFLSRVFEGPFRDSGKWVKGMDAYARSKGAKAKKTYFFYTTCPRCAKAYGRNYVVALAEIA